MMRRLLQKAGRIYTGQDGLTLVELVVAIGIISIAGALVAAPMFSVLRVNEDWRSGLSSTANWRQAAGYLSRDATRAETISLGDASPAVDEISMSWFAGATFTVDYALSGDTLLRTYSGDSAAVARGVESVAFTRAGNLLTMELLMEGKDEPIKAHAALRSLIE